MLHDTFNNLLLQRSQAEKNKLQKLLGPGPNFITI